MPKRVLDTQSLHLVHSHATTEEGLMEELLQAFQLLLNTPPEDINTLILIHPEILQDFEQYLDFLSWAEQLLEEANLDGIFQLASFHPQYQFAGTEPDAKQNYTNRSPYPMIHILREEEVERALSHHPDAEHIPQQNINTFESLSWEDIHALYD